MAEYITTPEKDESDRDAVGIQRLLKTVIEHVETRIELAKVVLLGKAANLLATTIAWVVVGILGIFALLFGFIAIGLWIGQAFNPNNYAAGFGIVTAFFVLLALIILLTKGRAVAAPLEDSFIESFFAPSEEDTDYAPKVNNK